MINWYRRNQFKVKRDTLIFYPHKEFFSLGILLACAVMMFVWVPFFEYIILASVFILFICIFFSLTSQIIVDGGNQKIYKKNLFGEKLLASFSDVKEIGLVSSDKSPFIPLYHYSILLKTDLYGKGILLHQPLRKKAKNLKYITEDAIPLLEDMLKQDIVIPSQQIPQSDFSDRSLWNEKLFKEIKPNIYCIKHISKNDLLTSACIIVFPIVGFGLMKGFENLHYIGFLPFIIIALLCAFFSSRHLEIDTQKRTITKSLWGIFAKTTYAFDDILNLEIKRILTSHQASSSYSSTDVYVIFEKNGKEKKSRLINLKDTKKLSQLMQEFQFLTGIDISKAVFQSN